MVLLLADTLDAIAGAECLAARGGVCPMFRESTLTIASLCQTATIDAILKQQEPFPRLS